MSDFVHLHCHSEYSLLDGAIRLKDLCSRAKDYGMNAAAVTDHGNLYAALPFYLTAKDFGVKPIIGCEVYVCHDHTDRTSPLARTRHHLVLLAQNLTGYHNLTKLVSKSAMYGFYHRPRVDKAMLREHAEGIVALSACLAGEVPKAILRGSMDDAAALAREYHSIFPGRFFLEMQSNGLKEQETVNEKILELAETCAIPLVATNDCHYLGKDDVEAHDILLCIQTQAKVDDPARMRFETKELYYKNIEEMEKPFAHAPEALANTARIAFEMCEDYNFDLKSYHFPIYQLPEGISLEDEFRRLAREGLKQRLAKIPYQVDETLYWERLEQELSVICEMQFPGYFLIVQDFINWAKDHGIPVGPGRGSAAGSLVAWAIRITNLDPIPYNLLFERFLNIERISMPDIDVDFCERKRHEVIKYVGDKYGEDSVAQITTFGKMKAKAVVRDVGRALGLSFQETDRIAKLIPGALDMTIAKALEVEPDLKKLYDSDPVTTKLIDVSRRLEGLSRHASTHAAGVVISDKPMIEYLPLYKGKREETVTQYDMKVVEKVGLVKFDFLGLKTMTLIHDTLDAIREQGKTPPDLDTLPLTDAETYKLYSSGDTDGIFQVESSGMRQYLRQLRPTVFEDVIAMLALYRPGPLESGMVDEFIKRKHGEVAISYPVPELENCLKDTYGVIVYQEQVMQIAQIVGKYTLGGADLLRRAMGKKDPVAMAKERGKFIEGAVANNVTEKKANEIFDLMEQFAKYGFNKSHSAAYALISYHTAYLKTHYKHEFMAALLTSEMGNQDKLLKYIAACKDMEIPVDRPSVQESRREFIVRDGRIVFGLGGVKNVGDEAIREIIQAREDGGPFASLLDLCSRVSLRKVTKRVLENLIKGGACDCLNCTRASMFAALDLVVARAQKRQKEKDSSQMSLFALAGAEPEILPPGIGVSCEEERVEEWRDDEKMRFEKEALGFFLTSHPLQPFRKELVRLGLTPLEECRDLSGATSIKTAVLVTGIKEYITKKGDRMAFCQVEDLTASGECTFFPEAYADCRELLHSDLPLCLECRPSERVEETRQDDEDEEVLREIKLLGSAVTPLEQACAACQEPVCIDLKSGDVTPARIAELKVLLEQHKGPAPMHVTFREDGFWCRLELSPAYTVQPGRELENDLAVWSAGQGA
ncbi:DNA polymerase III subunit alpha [uncultured delta proteobacterium]|uniref:DNA-directed DNA polymerase n=1 Tax=uncultured delta proteobacterium TaxID=34034 RepID=A0A212IUR7_9DELT|nr:DNA polymerase III subunit alpha [uncultured delta proteobacterium]